MRVPSELRVSPSRPEIVTREAPRERPGWARLMSSGDHKQVGLLYLGTALVSLVLAVTLLVLMRVQLIVPENTMIDPITFDRLLSAYGATAIVFFALPLAIGLATYVMPLQIGARGVALPRLAALSYWLYALGAIVFFASFLYHPSQGGTLSLPPLSDDAFLSDNGVDAWIAGVGLAVVGLVLASINLIVTALRERAPGMAWRRMPLFSWASTVNAWLMLLTGPILIAALVMLFFDRHFDGVFFESGQGGGPLLYQHLAWIFFTSAYAAIVIFAAGVISEVLPVFSRRPSFSHRSSAAAIAAIAVLGFFAWMQNMYTADIARGWLYMAMLAAVGLTVPIGVLLFNWLATVWGGALRFRAPLLFAFGAIAVMTTGLLGELASSVIPVGSQLHNTTSAWQDTHYALVGGAVFGGFAGLYHWFPKMTGRTMGEGLAKASFWAMLAGINLICIPMFLAGLEGQPVDVYEYVQDTGLDGYNLIASIGSFVFAVGALLTPVNAALSARRGARAGHDPWGGATLEWFAPSPPPEHNFDAIPDVRSAEPLLDIREAVRRRTAGGDGDGSARAAAPAEPADPEESPASLQA